MAVLPGTVPETAALVTAAGGHGVAVRCDHRSDDEVAAVFTTIQREAGRLDLLVNNATGIPDLHVLFGDAPFWEVGVDLWDDLFDVGLRSHFVAAQHAARVMVAQGRGLIVNVSSRGAQSRAGVLPYGVAKAALDRMTADMAADLRDRGVAVVSLWPPPSSTEGMLAAVDETDDPSKWSSPVFTGRVVAALAVDPNLMERTGRAVLARDLARELGVEDPAS